MVAKHWNKPGLENTAEKLATIAILPILQYYKLMVMLLGQTWAYAFIGQAASKWTGITGVFLRRALFNKILPRIGKKIYIEFGTVLTKPTIELGDSVYIGAYCMLGDVRIGDNTLIADHVCIPSGSEQHGIGLTDIPIREQAGKYETIFVGNDCWIGSGAIILANVGDHSVVGAGSIVTKPVMAHKIVAGNPARQIKDRSIAGKELS